MAAGNRLRFVDMFSGLGGFHIGLARLGHRCVFACESDERLAALYRLNFGLTPHPDIRRLPADEVPEHEILCAGFPCQPFSKAGEQKGLACDRDGDLFDHLEEIIEEHRPPYLLLENVPNLEHHNEGHTYQEMRGRLEDLGYSIDEEVLSPHWFGIPQVRERLFIVGSLSGLEHFEWDKGNGVEPSIFDVLDDQPSNATCIPEHYEHCLNVWQKFLDRFPKDDQLPSFPIWSMEFGADYPFEETTPAHLTTRQLAKYRGPHGQPLRDFPPDERFAALPTYARHKSFPAWKKHFIRENRRLYERHRKHLAPWIKEIAMFPPSLQKLEWNCKGEPRDLSQHILQFRASGIRVKRSTTAPALIAMTTTQVPIIASESRYMTVRECSRLQGMGGLRHLPDKPSQAYRALGNAVNAELVKRIAKRLVGQAKRSKKRNRERSTRRIKAGTA